MLLPPLPDELLGLDLLEKLLDELEWLELLRSPPELPWPAPPLPNFVPPQTRILLPQSYHQIHFLSLEITGAFKPGLGRLTVRSTENAGRI